MKFTLPPNPGAGMVPLQCHLIASISLYKGSCFRKPENIEPSFATAGDAFWDEFIRYEGNKTLASG